MADLLQSNEIFFQSFEPKVQNRFIMYLDGIPSFLIKKTDRPKITGDAKILDHINIQRKYRGKSKWNDISVELYDPIVPSGAQAVMEWIRLHHESVTGRDGYADFYKKDVTINVLGPVGDKVEEWTLKGAFISGETNFGTLDWSNDGEFIPITLQLSMDYCILQF
jgi:hypothetical protein